MWKKSKKLKKVKLKFTNNQYIQELANNLKILQDIQILDYKVTGSNDFSVAFSKNFVDYYNMNHGKLQTASLSNMMGAIKQFPEEFIGVEKEQNVESFVTMFYSTLIISYLNDTGLIKKIDPHNLQQIGDLIVTVEELREMMIEEEEEKK
jgi:hypothetical protein